MSRIAKHKSITVVESSGYKAYSHPKVYGTGPMGADILFVGESPGNDECIYGQPFVGYAGNTLNNCLSRSGIPRESVRIENISHNRPWDDRFENLFNTPYLESGLKALHEYILTYKPKVIGALGNYPMHYLTGKGKRAKGGIIGIGNWRGSILPYVDDKGIVHEDIKVIPTYHPSAVSRERSLYPIFDADIRRIKHESMQPRGLNLPEFDIIVNPTGHDAITILNKYLQQQALAIDIETIKGTTTILSIAFSPNSYEALVFDAQDLRYMSSIGKLLLSPDIMKIFHFGYFDTTQLKLNGYEVGIDEISKKLNRLYFYDTYIGAHVIEPELPNTLAFETSTRTRIPYYKQEGKEDVDQKGWGKKVDKDRLYRYNGKDTCATFGVFESQLDDLKDHDTFNFEMSVIELQTHISNSGMLIDPDRLKLLEQALITRWATLQYLLDGVAGFEVNVKSPIMKDWLYSPEKKGGLGLPTKFFQKKVTTNDAALVSLLNHTKTKEMESIRPETKKKYRIQSNLIRAIREIREIRQRMSMYIGARISEDGRSRSSYKYGPETGRWAASKYVDGTGYNHQTNPRDPIVVSDEDFEKYRNNIKYLEQLEEDSKEQEKEEEDDA